MDAATIKGVVDRLRRIGLIETTDDPDDRRRLTVALTDAGRAMIKAALPNAHEVTARTLAPLSPEDQAALLGLLTRLI